MSDVKARIGLFGGSFNPIHDGHIKLAKHAIKALHLDELIFIPCYKSVDKEESQYVSYRHRIAMIYEVLPEGCSVSTFEVDLRREVQTIETLKYFREVFGDAELFFLMGIDNLKSIDTWQDYDKLDEYAHLVVFRREGQTVRGTKGLRVKFIDNDLWPYSSSDIRSGLIEGVDVKVEIYMRENKLYGYIG